MTRSIIVMLHDLIFTISTDAKIFHVYSNFYLPSVLQAPSGQGQMSLDSPIAVLSVIQL